MQSKMAPVVISDAVAATPPAAAPAGDPPAVTPTAAAVAPPASPGLSIELTIHAVVRPLPPSSESKPPPAGNGFNTLVTLSVPIWHR